MQWSYCSLALSHRCTLWVTSWVQSQQHLRWDQSSSTNTWIPEELAHLMKDLGNPYDEESSDLIWPHTRDIMDKSSADCVATIQAWGQEQYMLSIQERLTSQVKAISEPIPRNKVYRYNHHRNPPPMLKEILSCWRMKLPFSHDFISHVKTGIKTSITSSNMRISLFHLLDHHMGSCIKARNQTPWGVWSHTHWVILHPNHPQMSPSLMDQSGPSLAK